jgi:Flp pilus assembly protein TadG
VVELALVLPVLLFLFLAIADFGRLFATMLTVEAGAREAADYGTVYPWQWDSSTSNEAATREGMELRACVATSSLPDYVGASDNTTCSNPAVTIELDSTPAGVAPAACPNVPRAATPCNVIVTLAYDFELILPLNINFFGTTLGLPSTVSFERQSVFAISDFEIDQVPSP